MLGSEIMDSTVQAIIQQVLVELAFISCGGRSMLQGPISGDMNPVCLLIMSG